MGNMFESDEAKKLRKQAKTSAAQAKQKEGAALAEAEDEVSRKRLGAQKGGRQSLIKTSPTGLANNLGGSA
jgi:hypothetical protein